MWRVRRDVRARAFVVCKLRGGASMRAAKAAIAKALADDDAVSELVPTEQVYAVERATIPQLPSIEVLAVTSERSDRPLIRHVLSCEITVGDPTEDGADELLDRIVTAIRARLSDAESGSDPIVLPSGAVALVELQGVRWSTSATDGKASSIVRAAAIAVAVAEVDEVGGRE